MILICPPLQPRINTVMNKAQELEEELKELFEGMVSGIIEVQTFDEAGILTRDRGVVVTLEDGDEYQISIVRSR
jgi:hypothetical protein